MATIDLGKGRFAVWFNSLYVGTVNKTSEGYKAAGQVFDSLFSAAWALVRETI